ncbi:M23 family metallopeptidase [Nocardia australiensis]|uniref:M23 family metallopeptidase n=1 Tax=Nocardia australiensis TaxID=2887191 RepID=UPI001D13DA76|nr:M23 family metallopeptidase [Nocardia australiensis]
MNHRSTLPPHSRARSGHRYRSDAEPFTPAADSRYATPAAGHAGYNLRDDSPATNGAWSQPDVSQQNSWSQQDSWADGGAWASDDPWTPDADNSWMPEDNDSWGPDADNSWASDDWASDDDAPDDDAPETPATPTVIPARRRGAHRTPAPPTALKGRAAVVAVAAGAVVAAGQAAFAAPEQPSQAVDYEAAGQIHEIAAQSVSVADTNTTPDSPQVLDVSVPNNLGQFNDILQKGQKYANELAAQEAAKLRPLFTKFASGTFTSGYGARWGVQHLGIDVAGPIGTPIVAVADGTVLEAGPASGFGMWVRLLHDDGTVTVYGHIDTATVSQGQRVIAGDQIATIGNRGFSTGPHCHFEVWLNGSDKVDPLPWLASRGISLGPQRD